MRNTFFALLSFSFVLSASHLFAQDVSSGANFIAPGILTTIQPCLSYDETFTRFDETDFLGKERTFPEEQLKEDMKFNPELWAKNARFSRDVWCLEFGFKPIRMIWVDLPGKDGVVEKKQVWYMVYSVKNTGKTLRTILDEKQGYPEQTTIKLSACTCPICAKAGVQGGEKEEQVNLPPEIGNQFGSYKPEIVETDVRFTPGFLLAADALLTNFQTQVDEKTGDIHHEEERSAVVYRDRVIPLALEPIARREALDAQLETTVGIATKLIKPHETLWGVATWMDIDPRINKFSVLVAGLTNAYRWREKTPEDEETGFNAFSVPDGADDPLLRDAARLIEESQSALKTTFASKRGVFSRKVLRLNFWRPGDQYEFNERQIRYGVAGEPNYEWYYRLVE